MGSLRAVQRGSSGQRIRASGQKENVCPGCTENTSTGAAFPLTSTGPNESTPHR